MSIAKKSLPLVWTAIITFLSLMAYYKWSKYHTINSVAVILCYISAISLIVLIVNKIRYLRMGDKDKICGQELYRTFGAKFLFVPAIVFSSIIVFIFTSAEYRQSINYHSLHREPSGSVIGYYVIAENEKGKEYTLPAEISFGSDYYTDVDYNPNTFEYQEDQTYERAFFVNRVYFKNGGYLYFEDAEAFFKENESQHFFDQRERWWKITLTDRYVKNEFIKEIYPPTKTVTKVVRVTTLAFALIQGVLWYAAYIRFSKLNRFAI